MCYPDGMTAFFRANYLTDILALVGLVLIGAAVYLAFGLPAALGYAGAALIVVAAVVQWAAMLERRTQ